MNYDPWTDLLANCYFKSVLEKCSRLARVCNIFVWCYIPVARSFGLVQLELF